MQFCFYPGHEYACPHVSHCPHLGGAALATLVSAAEESGGYLDMLHGQLQAERESVSTLLAEIESLQQQLAQVKLELRLERQSKFMTAQQKREADEEAAVATTTGDQNQAATGPRKRGAPVGHPGWFRATPTECHHTLDVAAPDTCPHCDGEVRCYPLGKLSEHLQEDVVDGVYQVVLFRHSLARCRRCRRWVQQPGDGELLGSRIGPKLRAIAFFLRNDIGVSYRKVPRTLRELFNFPFTPAALIGFEKLVAESNNLAERALRPLVVLRKITFGHRTSAGAQRMARLMTVQETAKRHGHKATEIFYRLLTQPPNRVLEYLYAGGAR